MFDLGDVVSTLDREQESTIEGILKCSDGIRYMLSGDPSRMVEGGNLRRVAHRKHTIDFYPSWDKMFPEGTDYERIAYDV